MTTNYHFNKETGRTGKCDAKIKCRLGLSSEEHFSTKEEAQKGFEKTQEHNTFASSVKKKESSQLEDQFIQLSQDSKIELIGMTKKDASDLKKNWEKRYKFLHDVENGVIDKPVRVSPEDLLAEPVDVIRHRGESIESVETLLEDYYDQHENLKDHLNFISGDYVVIISARQGGGNRECWCDNLGENYDEHDEDCLQQNNEKISQHPNYITDYDDYGDPTYNYFIFDNGITEKQINHFKAREKSYSQLVQLTNEKEKVEKGEAPVWFINDPESYNKNFSEYSQAKKSYELTVNAIKKEEGKKGVALTIVNKLNNNNINDITLDELGKFNNFRKRYSEYDLQNLKGNVEKIENYNKLAKAYKEAEALDDNSPLKQHLLGDRGTGTYTTTEKRGRKNVQVKKTYEKGSILGKEVELAKRLAESAKRSLKEFSEPFQKTLDEYYENFNSLQDQHNLLNEARNKVWAAGWKYDVPVPDVPTGFLKWE